jgi:hypothetical protein
MTERGMLFGAPMVRALLEGCKTQTRRPINRLLGFGPITEFKPSDTPGYDWTFRDKRMRWNDITEERLMQCCPWQVGDHIVVRETWTPGYQDGCWGTIFRADGAFVLGKRQHAKGPYFHAKELGPHISWRPSIHLPNWASRLVREIGHIGHEPVQEISGDDCVAEGIVITDDMRHNEGRYEWGEFGRLWDSTYGPGSWERNGWVWALTFEVVA